MANQTGGTARCPLRPWQLQLRCPRIGRKALSVRGGRRVEKGCVWIGHHDLSTALALTPVLSPSTGATTPSGGTDPKSPLCKADFAARADGLAAKDQAVAAEAQKAIDAGNWPAAKSDLLSGLRGESGGYLIPQWRTAPRKEQAELTVIVKFLTRFKSLIQRATSVTAYASSVSSLSVKAAVAAENALAKYEIGLCGIYPGQKIGPAS